jgi:hypothetical protein
VEWWQHPWPGRPGNQLAQIASTTTLESDAWSWWNEKKAEQEYYAANKKI